MSTVMIVGATRGIGLELTKQYAEEGNTVIKCTVKVINAVDFYSTSNVDGKVTFNAELDVDGDVKNRFFEGKETAPGTKSSAMNEIGTGWGLSVLNDNPNASTEEVMEEVDKILDDKLKNLNIEYIEFWVLI